MTVKLYYDFISQPCRALYIFLKLTKIPFESNAVNLLKGEHLSQNFKEKFSKIAKVPFIHHRELKLNESVAIIRYLTREYAIADHWYPKDSTEQAKVDEFLEWQHFNLRLPELTYFRTKWIGPARTGQPPDEKKVLNDKNAVISALKNFEELFLGDTAFIHGEQISYSDLQASCEIEQSRFCGFDPRDNFPRIKTWMESVRGLSNPHYDYAHEIVKAEFEKCKLKENIVKA